MVGIDSRPCLYLPDHRSDRGVADTKVSQEGSPRNAKARIGGSSMGHNAEAMGLIFKGVLCLKNLPLTVLAVTIAGIVLLCSGLLALAFT